MAIHMGSNEQILRIGDCAVIPHIKSTLVNIAVITPPNKTIYTEGEIFDPTGMVVMARYSDGSILAVSNYEILNGDQISKDMTTINISYRGLVTEYEVGFNTPISSLLVGDSIYLKVNEVDTKFIIINKGKPSDLYDDSCNGVWLMMEGCCESTEFGSNNINNYEESYPRRYLGGTFLTLLDQNVRNYIKTVNIPYFSGGNSTSVSNLTVKCFILSGHEVGFIDNSNSTIPVDGATLEYFVVNATTKRDADVRWWLRSPYMGSTDMMWIVEVDGGVVNLYCDYADGDLPASIRPVFILPPNFDITNYAVEKGG